MKTNHTSKSIHYGTPARLGFTLVELLVVIVIIVTMASLVFVGIRKMKAAADKVVAARNISQLQLASTSYANDHGGSYMWTCNTDGNAQTSGWSDNYEFLTYVAGDGGVIKGVTSPKRDTVPLNLLDPTVIRQKKKLYDFYDASFGYNYNGYSSSKDWGVKNATRSYRMSELKSPERSAAFISATDWLAKYSGRFNWDGAAAVEGGTGDGKIAFRYGGKALVVYFDGHVAEITKGDLKKIDDNGGVANIFWDADGP